MCVSKRVSDNAMRVPLIRLVNAQPHTLASSLAPKQTIIPFVTENGGAPVQCNMQSFREVNSILNGQLLCLIKTQPTFKGKPIGL